jgi:hypothetical protein
MLYSINSLVAVRRSGVGVRGFSDRFASKVTGSPNFRLHEMPWLAPARAFRFITGRFPRIRRVRARTVACGGLVTPCRIAATNVERMTLKVDMTQMWFRNPATVLSVCVEESVSRLTFTRQQMFVQRLDPIMRTRQFYLSTPIRPKIMVIGIQGAAEYTLMDRYDSPRAVYPVWSGTHDHIDVLYDFIENPWGESEKLCGDKSVTSGLRPILGQKHRVIIHNMPPVQSGTAKDLFSQVYAIQQLYPNVELFINGCNSFSTLFGLGFKAADYGIGDLSDMNNQIILPNGLKINRTDARRLITWEDWVKTMGFTLEDVLKGGLEGTQNRTRLRIRSVRWASSHWQDNYRFHMKQKNVAVDIDSSDADYVVPQSRAVIMRRKKFTLRDADLLLCDRCRISPGCKAFRTGSICGLRESKVGDLEKYFQTRSAGKIIDGLASLTQLQARRLENSMEKEVEDGEVDPDVTRQINSLFANGTKLAMLVDPSLKGGPSVQVNVGVNGGNAQVVASTNPKEIMAGIVYALEQQGIDREKITPAMVEGVLSGMGNGQAQQAAIEGTAVKHEEEEKKFLNKLNEKNQEEEDKRVKVLEGMVIPKKTSPARDE